MVTEGIKKDWTEMADGDHFEELSKYKGRSLLQFGT